MKRLLVFCDGTWQDSTTSNISADPTNVTRLSRAISSYAVAEDGSFIPQIVFYQPGVGTSLGDKIRGGIYGAGLSGKIRAAYGFLCHNYQEGDEIFFFGFSRGAYTVRSIAGLTTSLGLLTKRGMDKFPQVYEEYYNHGAGQTPPNVNQGIFGELTAAGDLRDVGDAVKIVGVWDTVGFHGAGLTGENIEFYNQRLSPRVGHAYHALSLDESRGAFQPTLWEVPQSNTQDLQQVWFSGSHSEVGGGLEDSRLSDISLAWMVAQCAQGNKLAFIDGNGVTDPADYYLLDHNIREEHIDEPWATAKGPSKTGVGIIEAGLGFAYRLASGVLPFIFHDGTRVPESRITRDLKTNETIHRSIRSRDLHSWPCAPLKGTHTGSSWTLAKRVAVPTLEESVPSAIELRFKGRVRPAG